MRVVSLFLLAIFSSFVFAGTPDQWRASGIPAANNAANISPTANAAGIDVIFGPSAASNKALVVQAKVGQSQNLVEFQDSTGAGNFIFGNQLSSTFLQMTTGASAPVSAASTGRIIYNNTTGTWQISVNGGAYADIATTSAAPNTYIKTAVRLATTLAGTLATSFENGDAVDGLTLATGDRILLKNQATPSQNGIYTVNASGAPTRATDSDTTAEFPAGTTVTVTSGTANNQRTYMLTWNTSAPTLDTSSQYWQVIANGTGDLKNTYFGQNILNRATSTNSGNTFIGADVASQTAGNSTTTNSVVVGATSYGVATGGTNNVIVGYGSAGGIASGSNNVIVGGAAATSGAASALSFVTVVGGGAGAANTGDGNTFVGQEAGVSNTSSTGQTFLGYTAGRVVTGADNTIIGYAAADAAGAITRNVIIGKDAAGTTGGAGPLQTSVIVGYQAGMAYNNAGAVIIGDSAGKAQTTDGPIYIGRDAGLTNTAGANVVVGGNALDGGTTGGFNTIVGTAAATSASGGDLSYCSLFGHSAGAALTGSGANAAWYNTLIGANAGDGITTGTRNVFVGYDAGGGNASTTQSDGVFVGYQAGLVNTATTNTFIGNFSGDANTSGTSNTYVGYNAGTTSSTSSSNTYVGWNAGRDTTGAENTFLGSDCGLLATSINSCVFAGYRAGRVATGSSNVYVGHQAGDAVTSGAQNVVIGKDAGGATSTMADVVFAGFQAGLVNTADRNVFIGSQSGSANTSGTGQCFVGYQSGVQYTGNNNTVIGNLAAGTQGTTGADNVLVGYFALPGANAATGTIVLGSQASGASNTFVAGSSSAAINDVHFGKGITNATATAFTVNGTGGSGTNNAGANIQIAGGKGTGTAEPGLVVLKYPLKTTTGTTLQSLSTQSYPVSNVLFSTTTAVTVNATVTETTLLSGVVGSTSLEGGMLRAGRILRFTVNGTFTSSATPPTFTMRCKAGTTSISGGGAFTPTANLSGARFEWTSTVFIQSFSSTGAFRTDSMIKYMGNSTPTAVNAIDQATGGTFDMTATQTIDVTVQYSAATGGNSVVVGGVLVEVLN